MQSYQTWLAKLIKSTTMNKISCLGKHPHLVQTFDDAFENKHPLSEISRKMHPISRHLQALL